ncbi:glycine cleavage system protein GcvH [Acidobacteria bacterium AH-259-D05]|nr:glycine cleavage system protein GcvH [Acidobacteria bacterium AH-259-D05]
MTIPDNLYYSKEHQWVSVGENTATIGITEHAQKQLGEVIFVTLPEVGESFVAEAVFGSLESIKAVSEVYMPVAGKVEEVNQILPDTPAKINEDPYSGSSQVAGG